MAASVCSFLYFWRQDALLLYGDAVAHLNIARRVFDSRTPGPLQLGTVWLPLPHLLEMPLVFSDWLWRTGVGGSVVSMASYVAGALGIHRLARALGAGRAAWLATAIFVANPNLLYLQTTAMTEPLYLALWIWTIVHFAEFAASVRSPEPKLRGLAPNSLERCGILLAAAVMTRYDAWFGALLLLPFVVWPYIGRRRMFSDSPDAALRASLRRFLLLALATPALWMAYNYGVYGNAVEFATGPYSARGIAAQTTPEGSPPHPGHRDVRVAGIYFLKAVRLNLGDGFWQNPLLLAAVAGSVLALGSARSAAAAALLWFPALFYPLSMAYGSVPIFVPVWWPFSFYNVRYGLQLLPAVAVFSAVLLAGVWNRLESFAGRTASSVLAVVLVAGSYASAAMTGPICLREARVNSVTRVALERQVAAELARLPQEATLLMHLGSHGGALQRAGIPLRRVIHEGNYRQWEWALSAPGEAVDYLVAFAGDAVSASAEANAARLEAVAEIEVPGQPGATVYRTLRQAPRSEEPPGEAGNGDGTIARP